MIREVEAGVALAAHAATPVRDGESHPTPAPDAVIHVVPRDDRVHWFNAETGKRL